MNALLFKCSAHPGADKVSYTICNCSFHTCLQAIVQLRKLAKVLSKQVLHAESIPEQYRHPYRAMLSRCKQKGGEPQLNVVAEVEKTKLCPELPLCGTAKVVPREVDRLLEALTTFACDEEACGAQGGDANENADARFFARATLRHLHKSKQKNNAPADRQKLKAFQEMVRGTFLHFFASPLQFI